MKYIHKIYTSFYFVFQDYFVNGPRMESAFRKHFFRADKSQTDQSFEIIVGHGNLFRFFTLR